MWKFEVDPNKEYTFTRSRCGWVGEPEDYKIITYTKLGKELNASELNLLEGEQWMEAKRNEILLEELKSQAIVDKAMNRNNK